jgi:membrane protein implicated in regulation of membrane protease activity
MDASTFWWIAAAGLVIAELLTGTFYLLMVAMGLAAGALAAHAGLSWTAQIAIAAAVGAATTVVWHLRRPTRSEAAKAQASRNADVNQDIGATIYVEKWAADGTAQVKYRGAMWSVIPSAGARNDAAHAIGSYRVKEVVGSRLVVEPV